MIDRDSVTAMPEVVPVDGGRDEGVWIPLETVLAAVHDAGEGVTIAQLDRWQRRGLLPARSQRHRPGQAGSMGGYQSAAIGRIVTLARLRRKYTRLDELAIAAWLVDPAVEPATARVALADVLTRATALPERARALLRDPATGDPAAPFDAADAIVTHLPAAALRSVGLPDRADRATVATVALEWWLGGTPLWAGSGGEAAAGLGEATPQELLGRSLDLEDSALLRGLGVGPDGLTAGLDWWRTIGIGSVVDLPPTILTWNDAETAQVRDDLVACHALMGALSALIPCDHGDPALDRLLRTGDAPPDEIALRACALVAARRSGFAAALDALLANVPLYLATVDALGRCTPSEAATVREAVWRQLQVTFAS